MLKRSTNLSFFFNLCKRTFIEFFKEKSFFHGAALSYYTVFALVPMLYLSITFFGWFVGNDTMIEIISQLLTEYIGIKDIDGILEFLKEVDFEHGSFVMNAVGIGALLLSCTALLGSLKASMNEFYDVEPVYSTKRKKMIQTASSKLVSIAMMTAMGVIVVVFYFAETVVLSFLGSMMEGMGIITRLFNFFLVHSLAIIFNTLIFSVVFKYLHDGIVKWNKAIYGALFTGALLYFGQILIKFYIGNYFFAANGGVAGSILIILVWMYYSSQIIFLGAKFTKVLSDLKGTPILNKTY